MPTEATIPTREAISAGATLDERLAAYFAWMEYVRTHCPDCGSAWTDGDRCPHCGLGVWNLDAAATLHNRNQEVE
jgi:methionyl-tRNA synthetase